MKNRINYKNIQNWPDDGLESVPICPVCGGKNRKKLFDNLTDRIFFCAPGKWTLYSCDSCSSAYLDPRPSFDSIGLAYDNYFTHIQTPDFSSLTIMGKIKRCLVYGDINYRYGPRNSLFSLLGVLAIKLYPNGRATIDEGMRHLPFVKKGQRLLDLGCGNGEFLLRARSAGWSVVGVDFDPKAVHVARNQSLDVRLGGVDILDSSKEQFDVITLSHVIEHVHDPISLLQACYRLLNPDGYLWLETPNITSEGCRIFGSNWRGLEPPRHQVLFSLESMQRALNKAGFMEAKVQSYRPLCRRTFDESTAIMNGIDPYSGPLPNAPFFQVKRSEKLARTNPASREFITMKAWKE